MQFGNNKKNKNKNDVMLFYSILAQLTKFTCIIEYY